jgi:hypothetical protein
VKLSELTSNTRDVEIPIGNGTIAMTVRTDVITPKLASDFARLLTPTQDTKEMLERSQIIPVLLCKLVASWDLQSEDVGEPIIPLTVESVSDLLPLSLQINIIAAGMGSTVGEDSAPEPSKQKSTGSGAGSSTRR